MSKDMKPMPPIGRTQTQQPTPHKETHTVVSSSNSDINQTLKQSQSNVLHLLRFGYAFAIFVIVKFATFLWRSYKIIKKKLLNLDNDVIFCSLRLTSFIIG